MLISSGKPELAGKTFTYTGNTVGLKPRKPRLKARVKKDIKKEISSVASKIGRPASERMVINKDGTIDAEVRIQVPRGVNPQEILTDLATVMKPVRGTWISSGVIFPPRDESEEYEKLKGMSIARTYAQRNTSNNMQANLQGGQLIAERIKARGRRKASHVIVRIHWNKGDKQPDQPHQRAKQKK